MNDQNVLMTTQAYTAKRRILIEVLPVPNAYTKFANACIHYAKSFCYLLMHICILKMHICMSRQQKDLAK